MSVTDELLQNNARYAASFDKGNLPLPPARGVAVVACMDARLDTHKLLGLDEGDAHVIRNAGGVVSDDAIRSLVISQRLLGTREIIIIQHTDCGMLTFRDDDVKGRDRGRHRPAPVVLPGGVRRPGGERPPVDTPRQGQSLHSGQGQRAWLRVRLRDRPAERGRGRVGAMVDEVPGIVLGPAGSVPGFGHVSVLGKSRPCRREVSCRSTASQRDTGRRRVLIRCAKESPSERNHACIPNRAGARARPLSGYRDLRRRRPGGTYRCQPRGHQVLRRRTAEIN